jgi:hypothetical protein
MNTRNWIQQVVAFAILLWAVTAHSGEQIDRLATGKRERRADGMPRSLLLSCVGTGFRARGLRRRDCRVYCELIRARNKRGALSNPGFAETDTSYLIGCFSSLRANWIALCMMCVLGWCSSAFAYRPFDSTDADVAGAGTFELELGPVGYLKEGRDRFLVTPAAVANFGLAGDREFVVEGTLQRPIDDTSDRARTSLVDTGLFLKQVHRPGSLQESTGPSVATECGLLLPNIHGESGMGARCAGIVSQRWPTATVHLNAALALTRQHNPDLFLGAILEGPYDWAIRPALELFAERESGKPWTFSTLVGAIWRAKDNLSFDIGVRVARADHENVKEVRMGLTWGLPSRK